VMLVEVVGGRALVSMSMVSILFSDMGSMVEDCLDLGRFVCIPSPRCSCFTCSVSWSIVICRSWYGWSKVMLGGVVGALVSMFMVCILFSDVGGMGCLGSGWG